jgi:aryl-alcohol dehydrogenase-like predicted oxidoreductase
MKKFVGKCDRRTFLSSAGSIGAIAALNPAWLFAGSQTPIKKKIPQSGELLPVIGMGSARTFDVGDDASVRARLAEVLQAFFDYGGSVIDSSPMYGSAEQVIGDLLKTTRNKQSLFAATKVWIDGKQAGVDQMRRSMKRMGVQVFDLLQIHNLRDWQVHLETLRDWKAQGKVRYIGITTSHGRFHDELESILEKQQFDFVQFSYNIDNRVVEKRLLPLAADRGIATLINRPYQKGELFRKVKGKKLPDWAADFDCDTWGQFFLKFVVSHPAVTCAIPATTKVNHMIDNMRAGFGRLPDARVREKMIRYIQEM